MASEIPIFHLRAKFGCKNRQIPADPASSGRQNGNGPLAGEDFVRDFLCGGTRSRDTDDTRFFADDAFPCGTTVFSSPEPPRRALFSTLYILVPPCLNHKETPRPANGTPRYTKEADGAVGLPPRMLLPAKRTPTAHPTGASPLQTSIPVPASAPAEVFFSTRTASAVRFRGRGTRRTKDARSSLRRRGDSFLPDKIHVGTLSGRNGRSSPHHGLHPAPSTRHDMRQADT